MKRRVSLNVQRIASTRNSCSTEAITRRRLTEESENIRSLCVSSLEPAKRSLGGSLTTIEELRRPPAAVNEANDAIEREPINE